jgi:hypothetical protein
MWNNFYFRLTGSRITLLVGQFIVLLVCLSYVHYVYTFNILPDKEAKEDYKESSCFLISKKLSMKGRFIQSYRADFLISYNVNGVQYNRWVSGNGLDISFSKDQAAQKNILSQFDVGGTYPCWFNPDNPSLAVLVLRYNWLSTFPLMIPFIIIVIVFYYFIKNLYTLTSKHLPLKTKK